MCTTCFTSKSFFSLKDYLSVGDCKILYNSLLNSCHDSLCIEEWLVRPYSIICFFGTGCNGKSIVSIALERAIHGSIRLNCLNEDSVVMFPRQKVLLYVVGTEKELDLAIIKSIDENIPFAQMNFLQTFDRDPSIILMKINELVREFRLIMH